MSVPLIGCKNQEQVFSKITNNYDELHEIKFKSNLQKKIDEMDAQLERLQMEADALAAKEGNNKDVIRNNYYEEDDEDDGIIEITTEAKSKPFVYAGLGGSKPAPPLFKQELNAKLQNDGKKKILTKVLLFIYIYFVRTKYFFES